jgi:hypothetical protein
MYNSIADLEMQVTMSHARLEKGELGAAGLRLLTAVDRSLRLLRRELLRSVPAKVSTAAEPAPGVESKPESEPDLAGYLQGKAGSP